MPNACDESGNLAVGQFVITDITEDQFNTIGVTDGWIAGSGTTVTNNSNELSVTGTIGFRAFERPLTSGEQSLATASGSDLTVNIEFDATGNFGFVDNVGYGDLSVNVHIANTSTGVLQPLISQMVTKGANSMTVIVPDGHHITKVAFNGGTSVVLDNFLMYSSTTQNIQVACGGYFDMEGYRYAFQGMEKDDEVSGNGNSYTTQYRHFDPRLGRWKSLDPLMQRFPSMSRLLVLF